MAGMVVIDLDELWTFIPDWNDFCSISTGIGGVWNTYSRYSSSMKSLKRNVA